MNRDKYQVHYEMGQQRCRFGDHIRVAVDASNNVYVLDMRSNRSQKFSPSR